ncbi:MFS transporter [Pelagibius sp.]|uniref:MFS transporter n=1 Tax=Pelagibius sp. TaxID=1931238 RepID=UPI00261CB0F8|nr:MFS transporter [Pelagibius sp.]
MFFINGTLIGCWASAIPQIKQRLALDDGDLGMALLCFALGSILAMLFGGPKIDRFGSRLVVGFSALGFCLSLPLVLLAGSLSELLLVAVVIGFANGLMDVSMNAQGVSVERALERPILSSLHAFFSIGGMAGAGAAASVYALGGGLQHLLPGAAMMLLPAALIALRPLLGDARGAESEARLIALPPRPLWLVAAFAFIAFVCEGAMFDWSAVYLREVLNTGASTAALGFGVFSAAMAAARLLGDRVVARYGRVRVLRVSAVAAVLGYALALAASAVPLALAGYALIGFGVANIVPILFSLGGSHRDIGHGSGIAAVATAGYSGSLLGPAWVGFLAEAAGLRFSLALTALFLLLLVVFGARARDT